MDAVSASWRGVLVGARPWMGRVLSVHPRALNTLRADGLVVSLVCDEAGLSSMSVLVPGLPRLAAGARAPLESSVGREVRSDGRRIVVPGMPPVDISSARPWSGRPGRARRLDAWALVAGKRALLAVDDRRGLAGVLGAADELATAHARAARETLATWRPLSSTNASLSELVGLGPGLTPAGDDFLTGMFLAESALRRSRGEPRCVRIARGDRAAIAESLRGTTAAGRTLLVQAMECRFPAYLLAFVRALSAATSPGEVAAAVSAACGHGATSGSDAVAGFLWLGLSEAEPAAIG